LISFALQKKNRFFFNEKLLSLQFSPTKVNGRFVIVLNEVRITPLQSVLGHKIVKLPVSCWLVNGFFLMTFKAHNLFV